MSWSAALAQLQTQNGGVFTMPKKDTPEYSKAKEIQSKLKTEKSAGEKKEPVKRAKKIIETDSSFTMNVEKPVRTKITKKITVPVAAAVPVAIPTPAEIPKEKKVRRRVTTEEFYDD